MQIGAQGTKCKHDTQFNQRFGKRAVVRMSLADHGRDVVVDEGAGE